MDRWAYVELARFLACCAIAGATLGALIALARR